MHIEYLLHCSKFLFATRLYRKKLIVEDTINFEPKLFMN